MKNQAMLRVSLKADQLNGSVAAFEANGEDVDFSRLGRCGPQDVRGMSA